MPGGALSLLGAVPSPPGAVLSTLGAALVLLATLLPAPAGALTASAKHKASSCANANLQPTAANAAAIDAATLCLIDRVRAADHLRPLRANHELQTVAGRQTTDMVREDYFSDDTPSGSLPGALIAAMPYGAHAARLSTAQNLGWGTLSNATPAGIVTAWMDSPPHRAVILTGAFRDVGVGVTAAVPSVLAQGARGATYAVEFAVRD
jgi:uncharacterized protein YkwD